MDRIQLSFDTNVDTLARMVEAYASLFFYQEEIDGAPNPQPPTEFFKQKCIDWVIGNVIQYELSKASQEAIQTAQDNMEDINIT